MSTSPATRAIFAKSMYCTSSGRSRKFTGTRTLPKPETPKNDVIATLAKALRVEPEHFREYRIRVITQRLEAMPDLVDRLYKRIRG